MGYEVSNFRSHGLPVDGDGCILYAAFGMNTNVDEMSRRCPDAVSLGGFYLPNHRLLFRGVADFEEHHGSVLPVVLWRITPLCLSSLDRLEGFPRLYDRRVVNGHWVLYDMNGDKGVLRGPSDSYYRMIRAGYEAHGLDVSCLNRAVEEAS